MKPYRRPSRWPYLAILLAMLACAATAPRQWDRITHRQATPATVRSVAPLALRAERPARFATRPSKAPATAPQLPVLPLLSNKMVENPSPAKIRQDVPRDDRGLMLNAPVLQAPLAKIAGLELVLPELPGPNAATAATEPSGETLLRVDTNEPEASPFFLASPPETAGYWPSPAALSERLDELSEHELSRLWAYYVLDLLEELAMLRPEDADRADALLDTLHRANLYVPVMVSRANDRQIEFLLRTTQYALVRRLDVWRQANAIFRSQASGASRPIDARDTMAQVAGNVAAVDALLERTPGAQPWRAYLQLDRLAELARLDTDRVVSDQRRVARSVLRRLEFEHHSAEQQQFLAQRPFEQLVVALRPWAAEPFDLQDLLADVEAYELEPDDATARRIAGAVESIRFSPRFAERELTSQLYRHYRNANARLAVSEQLLNRLIPQSRPVVQPVNDYVLGNPVQGQATTSTWLRMRLLENRRQLRFSVEASGEVNSRTSAQSGPATILTRGRSRFQAGKMFQIGPRGLHSWPAVARSNSDAQLEDLSTDFDGLPLIGSIVQLIARNQHDQQQAIAIDEVDRRVQDTARARLDAEAEKALIRLKAEFRQQFLEPLGRLSLEPEPIELKTTPQRMVARVRLATSEQLGAHTARPQAPADSWLSLQMHQSAMNNIARQTQLEGHTFTLPELRQWVQQHTGRSDLLFDEELPEDVQITFADQDAVRLLLHDGRVQVEMRVKRLVARRRVWRDFVVRTDYQPRVDGLSASFARADAVSVAGEGLNTRAHIVLRGVFSKVFTRERPVQIIAERFRHDPRFDGLKISQMEIGNGWLALAIAPRREDTVAKRPVLTKSEAR